MEEVKLDAFRKKVRTRNYIGIVLLLIGAALIAMNFIMKEHVTSGGEAAGFFSDSGFVFSDFGLGFNFGIVCGFMITAIFYIYRNVKALKDDEKLKKLYIAETDERNLLILQKSGSVGLNVITIGLLIGASVSIYFNEMVFFTLLGACLFVSLVRLVFKLYYHKKY